MRYGDLYTLEGRFAGADFTGTLAAGADPACRWPVRLLRKTVPLPRYGIRPEPVDRQPGAGGLGDAPILPAPSRRGPWQGFGPRVHTGVAVTDGCLWLGDPSAAAVVSPGGGGDFRCVPPCGKARNTVVPRHQHHRSWRPATPCRRTRFVPRLRRKARKPSYRRRSGPRPRPRSLRRPTRRVRHRNGRRQPIVWTGGAPPRAQRRRSQPVIGQGWRDRNKGKDWLRPGRGLRGPDRPRRNPHRWNRPICQA